MGQNRAVDGDIVALKLLKQNQWVAPTEIVLEDEGLNETSVEEVLKKEEELKNASRKTHADIKPTGLVVGIIRRKWRQYCGILQPSFSKTAIYHLFIPADKKIPKIRIETRQAAFLLTQKIIVAIDVWPLHSRYPNVIY